MTMVLGESTVLGSLDIEPPPLEGFNLPPTASQLIAALDAGRLFAQISTISQLAVLHCDHAYAVEAITLCGDLAATVRSLGQSHEERNCLEALAVRFLLDLREELAPANLDSRWQWAIEKVLFDEERDALGSPHDERSTGNFAVAMVYGISAAFINSFRGLLSWELLPWLDLALHVQDALCPRCLVGQRHVRLPDRGQVVVWQEFIAVDG